MDYDYAATVLEVIDGDTVKMSMRLAPAELLLEGDLGMHVYIEDGWICVHENLRLLGINAPEKYTPEGKVSKAWLQTQLPVGLMIDVATHKDQTEKYGRYLAVLRRYDQDETLNDQLVEKGYAFPWDGHGTRPTS